MNLDFSGLRELSASSPTQNELAKSSIDKQIPDISLHALSDKNREKLEEAARINKEYAKNRLISDGLKCEVNKGLKAREDIFALFLKAVKAVSLITKDHTFYNVAAKDLEQVYGYKISNDINEKGV